MLIIYAYTGYIYICYYWMSRSAQFVVSGGITLKVDRFRSAWCDCNALRDAARPCHWVTGELRLLLPGLYGSGRGPDLVGRDGIPRRA